jgi:ABC-type dipeptide/oligopeptide/nickel transport system permease subunit
MALFPGLAIVLTVVAVNVAGDGVRAALDPRPSPLAPPPP